MSTATSQRMMRSDLRYRRALVLLHNMFQVLEPHLPRDFDYSKAKYDVLDLLMTEGIEIISDDTRAQVGLPPRGPDGWTAEELHRLEMHRLEVLYKTNQFIIPTGEKPNE